MTKSGEIDLMPGERELEPVVSAIWERVVAALEQGRPLADEHREWAEKRNIRDYFNISESERIEAMLARDAKDRDRERDRALAEQQLAAGGYVNLEDLSVPPTEEWLAKGPTRATLGIRDRWDERAVPTVRRDLTLRIVKLYRAGILCDDRLKACKVYRDAFDLSGMEGDWTTTNLTGQGGGGGREFGHLAKTEAQADAVRMVRFCRAVIEPRMLHGFDMVVLGDMGIEPASRAFRCTEKTLKMALRLGSLRLWQEMDRLNIWGTKEVDTHDVA